MAMQLKNKLEKELGWFGLLKWECIVMVIGDVNSDNSDNNDDTQKRNHHS